MNHVLHQPITAMLPELLAARASREGDDACLIEAETDRRTSYRELHDSAQRTARGLSSLGVVEGDAVATMLPHSIDTYRTWFGLAALGALEVPIGTRYRGRMLEHILNDSKAKVLVADAQYLDELTPVLASAPLLEALVIRGDHGAIDGLGHLKTVLLGEVQGEVPDHASGESPAPAAEPHDLAMVLYTSGTTGPSKGVLIPWGQVHATTVGAFPEGTFGAGKVVYGPFPPNHIGGRLFPCLGIQYGVPVVIRHAFSASAFWQDVERHGCTTTALVSAMASILWSAPASDADADNSLQDVLMVPLIPEYEGFATRFGVRLCTDFNMTEISIPTHSGWEIEDGRSCGRVRTGFPGYEVRVVDQHDNPLGPGQVGELVVRTSAPWALNAGYLGRPEETAEAWRNGWFHTGDAFRYDEEGRYYFVDRTKDAIRRRGENVSSFEVEREVLDHPGVLECAAVGVPSELSEEDIKVFVVRSPGSELTESMVIDHVRSKAADFMVPRYVEFLDALPVTEATNKVKKAELREREAQKRKDTSR